MANAPSLEETAADLELAAELLPRIPQDDNELADMRWAVAQAMAAARRDGAAVQLLQLAEELTARAEAAPDLGWNAGCSCGWRGQSDDAEDHPCGFGFDA